MDSHRQLGLFHFSAAQVLAFPCHGDGTTTGCFPAALLEDQTPLLPQSQVNFASDLLGVLWISAPSGLNALLEQWGGTPA